MSNSNRTSLLEGINREIPRDSFRDTARGCGIEGFRFFAGKRGRVAGGGRDHLIFAVVSSRETTRVP